MLSTIEKVLFLKNVDLFKNIPGEDLSHMAQIAEQIDYPDQASVFSLGEPGDAMYLIISGQAKVQLENETLAVLEAGECFGEMAILDAGPRSATIHALGELTLLKLQQSDFFDILTEKPEIALAIIKVLTERLREANKR